MMKKGTHKLVTIKVAVWEELTRIKYARKFATINDVIEDLLDDEVESQENIIKV